MAVRSTLLLAIGTLACCAPGLQAADAARPNVILIMTDDQGIGDFGATGNRVIKTPHLDEMASRSAAMTTFYVSPVCSPTRACLMTGRHNYRTRVIDTWLGRSMMDPAEVTVAEVLTEAGYATGIFGKWHLGDCYPMRPMDQGFQQSLVLRGGGLAQPSEPRENRNRYTDPILFRNGQQVQTRGYCTDVYFDEAMKFIDASLQAGRNYFVYLPTNAPHGPFHDVPESLRLQYMQRQDDLARLIVPKMRGAKLDAEIDTLARIAAMITNVDENVGRLFARLKELNQLDNTLVFFLTDNGPNSRRYVGNRRGMKSEVQEGGVRTVLWAHWPARLKPGATSDEVSAHIDLMPTILDACQVDASSLHLDGRSFLPLLEGKAIKLPPRTLVLQSHRGDQPQRYHNFMIREGQWKLLNPSGFGRERFNGEPQFELYDVSADPEEAKNLVTERPEVVAHLKQAYDRWFDDVSSTRPDNYAPPRIRIGTSHEPQTSLTRQDWRGGTWSTDSTGYWLLHAPDARSYTVELEFTAAPRSALAQLTIGDQTWKQDVEANVGSCQFNGIEIPAGDVTLSGTLTFGNQTRGVYQVHLRVKP